jgi:hypothetical protein
MNSGKSKNKRKVAKSQGSDQFIDASPGDDGLSELSPGQRFSAKPRSIQDTQIWKGGAKGLNGLWNNYLGTLKDSFVNMPRSTQLELISKGSIIVTMGVAVISLGLFYYFLPTIVRVFAAPALLVTAWFVGTKLVFPMVRDRLEPYLNQD